MARGTPSAWRTPSRSAWRQISTHTLPLPPPSRLSGQWSKRWRHREGEEEQAEANPRARSREGTPTSARSSGGARAAHTDQPPAGGGRALRGGAR